MTGDSTNRESHLPEDEHLAAELRAALDRVASLRNELHARGWTVHIRINDGVKVEIEKRIEL